MLPSGCIPVLSFLAGLATPDYAQLDVMGDTVNSAARTEGWAGKNTESKFAATGASVESIKDDLILGKTEKLELKGKTETFTLYEILGLKTT